MSRMLFGFMVLVTVGVACGFDEPDEGRVPDVTPPSNRPKSAYFLNNQGDEEVKITLVSARSISTYIVGPGKYMQFDFMDNGAPRTLSAFCTGCKRLVSVREVRLIPGRVYDVEREPGKLEERTVKMTEKTPDGRRIEVERKVKASVPDGGRKIESKPKEFLVAPPMQDDK